MMIFVRVSFFVTLVISLVFACSNEGPTERPAKQPEPGIHERVENGPFSVAIDIDAKEISVARRLDVVLTAVFNEGWEVDFPSAGEKFHGFDVIDYQTTRPELKDRKRQKITRSFLLEPFLPGDYTISPMEIIFRSGEYEEKESLKIKTPEIVIRVKSLLPEDKTSVKLNEIKPPVPMPPSYKWLWIGGAIAGMVIMIILIMWKRKKPKDEEKLKLPPHAIALKELETLIARKLEKRGEIKPLYHGVSNILRRYIESRFGMRAPEQTTEEFLSGLGAGSRFSSEHTLLLKNFLRHCDLVKFAEHQPSANDVQKTFDSCREFIQGTGENEE